MLKEYADVIPLVDNPKGWTQSQLIITHDPNPTFAPEMQRIFEAAREETIQKRSQFGDFNAPKAAVRKLLVTGANLMVETALTEYFVIWGIPNAASEYHKQALAELNQHKETKTPIAISTHNIVLLAPNGMQSPDEVSVLTIINDSRHGFAPGRLSVSYEGQMDPTKDIDANKIPSTHQTVLRTLYEEFGINDRQSSLKVDINDIGLLAVCAEKGSAYTSWCHAIWIKADIQELLSSYQLAPRRKDADSLLAVPLQAIASFSQDLLNPEIYQPYLVTGAITEDTVLKPHATVPWRIDALKDHLQTAGISI